MKSLSLAVFTKQLNRLNGILRIRFLISIALVFALPLIAHATVSLFERDTIDIGTLKEGGDYFREFTLRNTSGKSITINEVRSSCGCTEVTVRSNKILPGDEVIFTVSTDTSGKKGLVTKYIDIYTSASDDPFELRLVFRVNHRPDQAVNSSAIFKGRCITCHIGNNVEEKLGAELYNAVCFMCHKEPSVLSDDSRVLFIKTVSSGIINSPMPGFIITRGGPLTLKQIESLAEYYLGAK
jgi:hypothetical protein